MDSQPVVPDLSVFLLGGRTPDARKGMEEARTAERLGFKSAWLCERFDLKESGAIMGAAGAVTSRLGIGTAPVVPTARPPLVTASMGATLQSLFPGRFTLGVGRGSHPDYLRGFGFDFVSYPTLVDYCGIVKRLWEGENVTHRGPAGEYSGLSLHDLPEGPRPKIVFCHICGPRASRAAADPAFDGSFAASLMTPDAVRRSIEMTKEECVRIGRDPDSLTFIAAVAAAPDMDEMQWRMLIGVRIAFGMYVDGESQARWNGWDDEVVHAVRSHPLFANLGDNNAPDQLFNSAEGRAAVVEVTRLIPEHYIRDVSALGSASDCVATLEAFKRAGADEIVLYASNAAQNAALIDAWRSRPLAVP